MPEPPHNHHHASRARSARRACLEARRQQRTSRFVRFLRLTAVGTLIPGAGLVAAGRRRLGMFVLALLVLALIAATILVLRSSPSRLISAAFDRGQLTLAIGALAIGGLIWLAIALASHRALEPRGLAGGQRLAGALVVVVVASLVLTPLALGARYAWTQRDTLAGISRASSTIPDLDHGNPWEDKPRITVLLMGSDAGKGRQGARPDSLILASIDTKTGATTMFSLPRNLERVPFPEGTALHEEFPDGFTNGIPEDLEYMINSVYEEAPGTVPPETFAGSDDPGADATKLAVSGALGLDVDYYVMANLEGFQQIVDAIGGITVNVNYPVPIASKVDPYSQVCEWTGTPNRWIMPKKDKYLDGLQALWFARARCAPYDERFPDRSGGNSVVNSDYNRMERQRCVIGAIASTAKPVQLLPRFERLAAAARDNISTDIPPELFPSFAALGLRIKDASIESLTFDNKLIENRSFPDYDAIHSLVDDTLAAQDKPADPGDSDSTEDTDEATSDDATDEAGTPDSSDGSDPGIGDAENTDSLDVTAVC